jgi:Cu/Ag efflux pump CusA
MEEAVSGVKGQLDTQIYGDDLALLQGQASQVVEVMRQVKGIEDLEVFRVLGHPDENFEVDRRKPPVIKSTSPMFRMPLIPPREGMPSHRS